MFFGLGLPEWLTIIALVAALWLTLKLMARASVAYEKAREAREQANKEPQAEAERRIRED
jgi:hypothetical protein